VEERTEQCYREGLSVVTELDRLWAYYIQWCRERAEDDHVADDARLRAITRLLSAYRSATEAKHMTEAMVEEQIVS
jgi:hypothetical protein